MIAHLIRFVVVLLMSLLVGTMFGIWLGFNPSGLSAATYIEQQQHAIRALNTVLPAAGGVCIGLTAVLALRTKDDGRSRYPLIAAVVMQLGVALVTRFANQPINSQVMTWSAQAPAANWMELRDTWWHWHVVRTFLGLGALCLTLFAVLGGRRPA